ncbi:histidine--tRNA ligase [Candidatus Azambacteria bacterium RIFCSPHIGHO2_01_FULL_44_55]|uniref:Histidine--tRNA ligase n=1 Tax=Candidatus Azambacteria bacterium RIFCSPLOWO2_02_FULL_44_14 TaxID=1797306 RepID=A0A1F5CBE8_9BACT|nr:MAG: histidine--tRNA ligase [Candidatus Azambacteria bacterium RIFCSPLOWO2_01_FULL_44_84]OGD32713.1 MAG: histidine--tRNA ligase [Candidatus Azambacteria bacterium RIFCSPHIGHO2_02_FULL_45_18]OGD40166.1 MAG: histidine--tRNA ligase [Candidatus Azambacteria bacterium RIFCSPLOWO2_02_FULL_44_14]OGD41698.1 MAG: histidine--tRNA ligase [Candidatus Azambacteria bacterium RIFCSPHIGHO2_01_FULL_44_55]OGD50081.1 MAG: histidine--tRNA ligase [Candidatus Azambacteria bacterium RIFOXYD1_FULL_44_10]
MSRKGKSKLFQVPRGMRDILPAEQKYWERCVKIAKELALYYGFELIETPILENAELFAKGVGAGTDIVEKEMYTLRTKGGDLLALRPEGTPPIIRSYLENGMVSQPHPVKLFYIGPMFRHDAPQAGRYREHHQIGFETIGDPDPVIDAQIIQLIYAILTELGLKGLTIQINSIGDKQCRPKFRDELKNFYRNRVNRLCKNCKRKFKENPLRLFDCKEADCVALRSLAPHLIDHLDENCHNHFKSVLEFLDELGLPYSLNPYLVRGQDYYTRTVFEVVPEEVVGAQSALGGGGRFDGLIELLGGKPTPAVGGALGLERVIAEIQRRELKIAATKPRVRIFLAQLGDLAKRKSLKLFEDFRKAGVQVAESFGRDSIKAQLRVADRLGADISLIMGQKEALDNTVILREMQSGTQETIPLAKIIDEVKKRLKKIGPARRSISNLTDEEIDDKK